MTGNVYQYRQLKINYNVYKCKLYKWIKMYKNIDYINELIKMYLNINYMKCGCMTDAEKESYL